jgi:hypothetical protein
MVEAPDERAHPRHGMEPPRKLAEREIEKKGDKGNENVPNRENSSVIVR